MNINKEIRVMFCSNYNDKIIEKESYNDFISSFSKEKIENIYKIVSVMEDDNRILAHVLSLSLHPKKELIEDFTHNVKEMYKAMFSNSKEDILIQINMLLKEYSSSNIIEFELSNLKYSLSFIDFLNKFAIAKVKYLKKQEILKVYIPVELKNTLKELLKDKTIEDKCKKNTAFNHKISNLVATYGVITIKDLSEIYNKIYGKVNEKGIFNSVIINRVTDDGIRIVKLDTDYLVYTTAFEDDDDALSFYYSLSKKDKYKLYTKEEYEEIGEGIYHTKFKEYSDLCEFLEIDFNMSDKEIDNFDDMMILDYMFSYQKDPDKAKHNLDVNIAKWFKTLNFVDKAFICNSIKRIARNYPSFNYKGYSYNEINKN